MSRRDSVIADSPPRDGREWDCQCARCGSSTDFVICENCGGDGCSQCGGRTGFLLCLSSTEWCETHPLPERDEVKRGAIEWFVVERAEGSNG